MCKLWFEDKTEDEIYKSIDSDVVIFNLHEDGLVLMEQNKGLKQQLKESQAHCERLRETLDSLVPLVVRHYRGDEQEPLELKNITEALNQAPKQSLATIEAEAIEEAYNNFPHAIRQMWSGGDVVRWMIECANQLRKGG